MLVVRYLLVEHVARSQFVSASRRGRVLDERGREIAEGVCADYMIQELVSVVALHR